MKHAISEKLYFVYYLRNGVLSSEISPKILGFQSAECLEDFPLPNTSTNSKNNPTEIRVRVANLKPASKRRLYFVYYQALAG